MQDFELARATRAVQSSTQCQLTVHFAVDFLVVAMQYSLLLSDFSMCTLWSAIDIERILDSIIPWCCSRK